MAKDKKTAEEKFKEINEAYEVLSDSSKREKYDRLGAGWQQYEQAGGAPGKGAALPRGARRRGAGGVEFDFGGTGYSDFFEQFFGGRGGRGGTAGFPGTGGGSGGFDFFGGGQAAPPERGADMEADLSVTLEEAIHGSRRPITLRRTDGSGSSRTETYDVKIPAGVHEGQRIRLRSRGEAARGGGESGDLYLRVRLAPHPDFRVEAGGDLYHDLVVEPWQAVLGTEVTRADPGKADAPEDSGRLAGRAAFPPARARSAQGRRRPDGPLRAARRDAARTAYRARTGTLGATGGGQRRRRRAALTAGVSRFLPSRPSSPTG